MEEGIKEIMEVFFEGVLSFDFEQFTVEVSFYIEMVTEFSGNSLRVFVAIFFHDSQKVHVKYPVGQVIFVLEVIVKAFAIHSASFADIRN